MFRRNGHLCRNTDARHRVWGICRIGESFVEVLPSWAPNAYFEVDTHWEARPTVQFTNLPRWKENAETHWQWNFGDGIECWDCEEDSFTHTFPIREPIKFVSILNVMNGNARNPVRQGIPYPKILNGVRLSPCWKVKVKTAMHPADGDGDFRIGMAEAIAYLAGWQQGSNPMAHAIRAAYLWQNGEYYTYDPGAEPPLCWILETKTPLFPR